MNTYIPNKPLIICLTDIHGCFLTFKTLLQKIEDKYKYTPYELYILGDSIDRGPRSKEVINYIINNKIKSVIGNHCHMMIDYFLNQRLNKKSDYQKDIWLMNGGRDTIKSFNYMPQHVIDWMAQLPIYLIPKDYPDLLLSHTGFGLDPNTLDAVWNRGVKFPKDNYFRIFGHTPDSEVILTDKYANIDTGCAYKGKLTAFVWPTKETIDQVCID